MSCENLASSLTNQRNQLWVRELMDANMDGWSRDMRAIHWRITGSRSPVGKLIECCRISPAQRSVHRAPSRADSGNEGLRRTLTDSTQFDERTPSSYLPSLRSTISINSRLPWRCCQELACTNRFISRSLDIFFRSICFSGRLATILPG